MDLEISSQKMIGRVEHSLQTANIKLSVTRNENAILKRQIDNLRKEKLVHVQILRDLVNIGSNTTEK
jgi:hypothetical protein